MSHASLESPVSGEARIGINDPPFLSVSAKKRNDISSSKRLEVSSSKRLGKSKRLSRRGSFRLVGEEELRDAFDMFDEDKNGTLDNREIRTLLRVVGIEVEAEEMDELIRKMDGNDNGQVTYASFRQHALRLQKENHEEEIKIAFRVFDLTKDQTLTPLELKRALDGLGCATTVDEAQAMINAADRGEKGYVDEADLIAYLTK